MIKIFRKIRQKLLEKNKIGSYFKYAIGEIILVVIGILIALQINNWNEERKEQLIAQELKSAILSDLKMDLATIDSTLNINNSYLMSFDSLKQRVTAPGVTDDEIISAIKNDYLPYVYRFKGFNDNTYRSSSASGSIAFLDQDERAKFYSYYLLQSSTKQTLDFYESQVTGPIQDLNEDFPLNLSFVPFNSGRVYEQKWTNVDFNKLTSKFNKAGTTQRNYFRLISERLPIVRQETERLIKELEKSE